MWNDKNSPFDVWSKMVKNISFHNPALDPSIFFSTLSKGFEAVAQDPVKIDSLRISLEEYMSKLSEYILNRMQGKDAEPLVKLPKRDSRFSHDAWESNIFLDIMKQAYLSWAEWFEKALHDEELALDPILQKQLQFYTQQFIHGFSPNNFPWLNPYVIEEAQNTGGASLMKGFFTMMEDFYKSKDPDMTDMSYYKIGDNIANTKGSVVYRNDLIELIQYEPTTKDVFKKPLLVVPPWINKYYIFDLGEEKSMVRWLLEQGRTVFIISWVNPDVSYREKTIESYILEGPKAALDVVKKITNEDSIDAMGYCLGGTLLVCLSAYFSELKRTDIASLTLLTTLTDFSESGGLSHFMTDDYLELIESITDQKGYLDGRIMFKAFNLLRPSELVWPYIINNYYLGKTPPRFDFLYWNADSAHLPGKMYKELLRLFYKGNLLTIPKKYKIDGMTIDLSNITLPIYMLSTKDDHIAPWKATYKGINLMKNSNITFVLGGSSHVAGVINPPSKVKYGYWTCDDLTLTADDWQNAATEHKGSWWLHWNNWISSLDEQKVSQRKIGSKEYPPLCDAPGSYVMKRIFE